MALKVLTSLGVGVILVGVVLFGWVIGLLLWG